MVDPDGNLRVSTGNATVNTYSAHANGNVAALSRVTKAAANGLSNPRGLNFERAGHLVVADAGAERVDTFDVGASGGTTTQRPDGSASSLARAGRARPRQSGKRVRR